MSQKSDRYCLDPFWNQSLLVFGEQKDNLRFEGPLHLFTFKIVYRSKCSLGSMNKFWIYISLFLLAISASAANMNYRLLPERSQVHFLAVGKPSALRIRGEGAGLTGEITLQANRIRGVIHFPLSTLKTGIDLRDEHMRTRYLEIDKYPTATLRLNKLVVPPAFYDQQKGEYDKLPFSGVLTLKQESQPVTGMVKLFRDGAGVRVEATFDVKITLYPMLVPKYLGITLADDITVEVTAIADQIKDKAEQKIVRRNEGDVTKVLR